MDKTRMPKNQVNPTVRPIYTRFLTQIHALGVRQQSTIDRVWGKLQGNTQISTSDIVSALVDTTKAFLPVASHLAIQAYNELSPPDFSPQTVRFPEDHILGDAYAGALKGREEKTLDRVLGVAQRFLWNTPRETFVHNSNREGVGWKRAADVNACPFCRLLVLSTSKIVYHNLGAVNTHYHNNCHCFVVRADDYQNHPDFGVWEKQYNDAVAQAGVTSVKPLMAAWRQLDNA